HRLARLALWCGVIATVITSISFILPSHRGYAEMRAQLTCSEHMRELGVPLYQYARSHGDRFPDSLERLLESETVDPDLLVCPSSKDTATVGPSANSATALRTSGHLSYWYLGKGFGTQSNPGVIILVEPLDHHEGRGINVMYTD